MDADAPAIPPKPKAAAINATTRNVNAQPSMVISFILWFRFIFGILRRGAHAGSTYAVGAGSTRGFRIFCVSFAHAIKHPAAIALQIRSDMVLVERIESLEIPCAS